MCWNVPSARIDLPVSALAPRLARRFLADRLCVSHPLGAAEDAALLTSEIVTNAVRHGRAPIRLSVECTESHLEIRVSDANPSAPRLQTPDDLDTHGRGVALVGLLSDRWGVHQHPGDGKDVWFTLATR